MAGTRKQEPAAEVVPVDAVAEPVARKGATSLSTYVANSIVPVEHDSTAVYDAMIREILSKNTADDILAESETLELDDIPSRPFTLHRFRTLKSDFDEGADIYISMDIEFLDTPGERVCNTGNQRVMAQVFALYGNGLLPARVQVKITGDRRQNGFLPLQLVKVK